MKLPKGWHEVTIKQYLGINDLIIDQSIDMIDKQVRVIAELTGRSIDEIEQLDLSEFKSMCSQTSFLYEKPSDRLTGSFIIDGVKYIFYPTKPIRKAKDFIDLSHLTKDKDHILDNIHKIMAVFCKPETEQDFNERAEIFLQKLTIDKAYPIAVFFWTVFQKLSPIIQNSLIQTNQKRMTEMIEMLEEELTTNIGHGS